MKFQSRQVIRQRDLSRSDDGHADGHSGKVAFSGNVANCSFMSPRFSLSGFPLESPVRYDRQS
jgi:hypothetical protein